MPTDTSLRRVTERFEHVRDRVSHLFERDPDFRDLCEEYETCTTTVTRLEGDRASSEAMRKEYAVLVLRLEQELLRYLDEHPARES